MGNGFSADGSKASRTRISFASIGVDSRSKPLRKSVGGWDRGRYGKRMATPSTGTRVYLSLIGLMLAVVGGIFCKLMWSSYQRARELEKWPVVSCVILRSDIDERQVDPNGPVERRFSVLY